MHKQHRISLLIQPQSTYQPIKVVNLTLGMPPSPYLSQTPTRVYYPIRSDQGGELYNSTVFQRTVEEADFLLHPTATDAPFQNGMAKRPNRTLATMVRCILHAAGRGPEF